MEKVVCYSVIIWMGIILICLGALHNDSTSSFYNFGPNSKLVILGFTINNYKKYLLIVTYCLINSIFRSLTHNILNPWMTNIVQDITKSKPKSIHIFAYEVSYVITIYSWFDWFLNYNILLSQIDLLIIEICIDLIMAYILTSYYINHEIPFINKHEYEQIL